MKKNVIGFACVVLCMISFVGCGSEQGGLVTDQGSMTLEEFEAARAASNAADPGEQAETAK